MNGYANLLRGREVPAGYRGAALIRVVLECRHGGGGATKHILSLALVGSENGHGFKGETPLAHGMFYPMCSRG